MIKKDNCKMVLALPLFVNADLVAEVIEALAHFRYDKCDYHRSEYAEDLPVNPTFTLLEGEKPEKAWDYFLRSTTDEKNYYTICGEFVTLEMIDVIEDLKKILPIEIFFEAGERDGTEWDERGEFNDNAIQHLYFEDFHNRYQKEVSA